jgi:CRISPR-associated protein Cas1
MEPFRWLVDLSVLQAFESRVLDLNAFHFKFDDYRFRFNPEAKDRFIELLKEHFNRGVSYRGKRLKWDTVIEEKAGQLGRYLSGWSWSLDFSEPAPILERTDNRATRDIILNLTQSEARKRGIGKSTLHYLRKNAESDRSFRVGGHLLTRINQMSV